MSTKKSLYKPLSLFCLFIGLFFITNTHAYYGGYHGRGGINYHGNKHPHYSGRNSVYYNGRWLRPTVILNAPYYYPANLPECYPYPPPNSCRMVPLCDRQGKCVLVRAC